MCKKMLKLNFFFFALLCSFSAFAKSITFLQVDFAPYYILQGQNKGKGRDEEVIKLLSQTLNDYKFNTVFVPSSRALYELQNEKRPTCMLSLYKTTDRQKQFVFSNEYSTIGLAPTISIHVDVANEIVPKSSTSASLKDLVFKHQLILGKSTERSYGSKVDDIIRKIPQDNIIVRAGKDSLNSLTYMLLKKRIDLIIGYPGEHLYLQSKFEGGNKLVQFQISEAPKTVHGYIGCNKTIESQNFLAEADTKLAEFKNSSKYKSIMLRWVPIRLQPDLLSEL